MTTSNANDASAPSARKSAEPAKRHNNITLYLRKRIEQLIFSRMAFPSLIGLFILDFLLPSAQGIFLLLGVIAVAGFCAEEYTAFLRAKGLRIPTSLGGYSAILPVLVAFCARPSSAPAISPLYLTIVTLVLVFSVLMVALSLIAEISEKMLRGLEVFCLACGGSLVIGFALTHLLLMRQWGMLPLSGFLKMTGVSGYMLQWSTASIAPLAVLAAGWLLSLLGRIKSLPAHLQQPMRFLGLALISVILFWALSPHVV